MTTRIRYLACTPFSFRKEQATTKFATTYPCPTPYAVKVALIIGGIRAGFAPEPIVQKLKSIKIIPHPWGDGIINTHMIKHYEPPRKDGAGATLPSGYLSSTVVFREFLYFDGGVDLFVPTKEMEWLRPIFPAINCFGKQGSFFTFMGIDSKNTPHGGITFEGSDFSDKATWNNISNYQGSKKKPRKDFKFQVKMNTAGGGQNFIHLKFSQSEEISNS